MRDFRGSESTYKSSLKPPYSRLHFVSSFCSFYFISVSSRTDRDGVEVYAVERQSVGHVEEPLVTVARCQTLALLVLLNHFINKLRRLWRKRERVCGRGDGGGNRFKTKPFKPFKHSTTSEKATLL